MSLFKQRGIARFFGICIISLYALLIFKDPFSMRTLIPNFEPYPDTFYYIDSALNFVRGEGFNVSRESRIIKISVPPLYSVSLIPAFILKQDPRMAYYSNVVLSLSSLLLFWLILRRLFTNRLTIYFLSILYITNYYIYWVPSLIMAENITMTLYLVAVLMLLSKPTVINSVLTAIIIVAIYAAKYANIPVSGVLFLFYLIKIFSTPTGKKKLIFYFLISLSLSYTLLAVFEILTKEKNFFSQFLIVLDMIYKSVPRNDPALAASSAVSSNSWFGIGYVRQNIPFYINALFGSPSKFLWDHTHLVPNFIGIFGSIGIIWNIFNRKYSFVCTALFAFVISSIIFMSTFYTHDARYIYIAIPTLLIGFGLFLETIKNKNILKKGIIFNTFIILVLIIYMSTNFLRIKSQISLNLKYSETPWNYIAVLKMNEYFTPDKIKNRTKPVLISALPPFLIDYYTNENYTLLPLSYEQEFRSFKELVWGPNDYSDLPVLYTNYLNDGYDLYVSRAGLGNESYTNRDFNTIVEEFDTKLVQPGCYDQCNIYSVKLKEKNGQ